MIWERMICRWRWIFICHTHVIDKTIPQAKKNTVCRWAIDGILGNEVKMVIVRIKRRWEIDGQCLYEIQNRWVRKWCLKDDIKFEFAVFYASWEVKFYFFQQNCLKQVNDERLLNDDAECMYELRNRCMWKLQDSRTI